MSLRLALTQTVCPVQDLPPLDRLEEVRPRLAELRDACVEHHLDLLRRAKGRGAQLVCFGELFHGPYFALTQHPVWRDMAEDARRGPTVRAVSRAAAALGVAVVAPIYELDPESGQRFNTAVVIDAKGEVLGTYRKVHVPQGQNEQGVFDERYYYDGSDGLMVQGPANVSDNRFFPVFQLEGVRVGVAICYDRHFEGVMRSLAQNGAQVVVSPAVTFGEKSRRMWRQEFAVDACRHRIVIAGSNRLGQEPPWNQAFFGESHVVGPEGPLNDLSEDPRLVIVDVALDTLTRPDPSGWNLRRDLRPETYSRD
ncbi:MAG: nitrilase-related carbon-nitrogen hydrolase [Planctomycetota bacterium]